MEIEKDVPLPQPNTWRAVIDAMDQGDSILVDTQHQIDSLRRAAARAKGSIKSKKEGSRIRCWLIRSNNKTRGHSYQDSIIHWEDDNEDV